jgi:hypothetical protein
VVKKLRERLSVSNRATQKFNLERFNFNKLNEAEVKEQYRSTSETGLQVPKTWMIMWTSMGHGKVLGENIKILAKDSLGHFKLQQHNPWFEEGHSD